ncbi:NAD(P)/FAD-dependent oxidoreductase [Halomonas binhaiensis]|uniref:NAD(P)/FAD-dependent oxidoreductase n=1 Tax=Halomonas binhaiensis TaxID=2562282 RepID=A0A5C1NK45_9GAMM|nr:FAD-dependent oxidoreductase [Halomonas binhaiensis]QEM82505.1 NAD(P)/FAD-dependent oxidoreductase [Halomonas binhaiensis]
MNHFPVLHQHLVIVGNGMAAHRLVESLRKLPGAPSRITVIGEEHSAAYNRIMLSPWLAGEIDHAGLLLPSSAAGQPEEVHAAPHVETRQGLRATTIDRAGHQLHCANGEVIDYNHLVIATGSRSFMPELAGLKLKGVGGFRDLQDAENLASNTRKGGAAVVIGGGLLGLEAAEGLRKRGMQVTVLQRSDRLMNRQLDTTAARMLTRELESRGLYIITAADPTEIIGNDQGQVCGIRLAGRTDVIAADQVVIAAGITPNIELGLDAGLDCQHAILVDEYLATSDPDISALGECCQFQNSTYGLVDPIWRQVDVLAKRLCGQPGEPYRDQDSATKLKISGISLYAFGPTDAAPHHEVLSYHDPEQGEYRRLLLHAGRLEGAVLYGDTRMGPWLFQLAQDATHLDGVRQSLLLGQADTEALLTERLTQHQIRESHGEFAGPAHADSKNSDSKNSDSKNNAAAQEAA